jgi:hypothetical protein
MVRRLKLRSLPIKAERETEMRKTLRASILLLALSCTTYAGIIPNDSPASPQPAPTPMTVETISEPANDQAAEPTVAEIALTLLQTVLAIF